MRALVAAVALQAGCSAIFGLEAPERRGIDAGEGSDGDLDGPSDATARWGNLKLAFLTNVVVDDPSLTTDMLEMYLECAQDICVTTRLTTNEPWPTPTLLGSLSSPSIDTTPEVTGNGLFIVVASTRSGSQGQDLWYASRSDRTAAWGMMALFPNVNSASNEAAGSGTADGLEVMLCSDRPGGAGGYDIYRTTRPNAVGGVFGTPMLVPDLNSGRADGNPHITRDGTEMYFDVKGDVDDDLYHSDRLSPTSWTMPAPITELNSAANDGDPWVSADGRHIYFASDRDGAGNRIYEATR